jgi:hypothetical protein
MNNAICKYIKAGKKCSATAADGSKLCKSHLIATSPLTPLFFDDKDNEFADKQVAIKEKIGILLQDMNVTKWRFDGEELYMTGDKKLLASLVGKMSPPIMPTAKLFEFGMFIRVGQHDMAIPTSVFVSWDQGSTTVSDIPEQWKSLCKTLKYF